MRHHFFQQFLQFRVRFGEKAEAGSKIFPKGHKSPYWRNIVRIRTHCPYLDLQLMTACQSTGSGGCACETYIRDSIPLCLLLALRYHGFQFCTVSHKQTQSHVVPSLFHLWYIVNPSRIAPILKEKKSPLANTLKQNLQESFPTGKPYNSYPEFPPQYLPRDLPTWPIVSESESVPPSIPVGRNLIKLPPTNIYRCKYKLPPASPS